jgi:prefoldin subunit 5
MKLEQAAASIKSEIEKLQRALKSIEDAIACLS